MQRGEENHSPHVSCGGGVFVAKQRRANWTESGVAGVHGVAGAYIAGAEDLNGRSARRCPSIREI